MSWGTIFNCDIFLIRQSFYSYDQLQNAIDKKEDDIAHIEGLLKMYASANPRDVAPEEWKDDPIGYLHMEMDSRLRDLSEYHKRLSDLRHFARVVDENPDKTFAEIARPDN